MECLQYLPAVEAASLIVCFKPCYKWNAFNTVVEDNIKKITSGF